METRQSFSGLVPRLTSGNLLLPGPSLSTTALSSQSPSSATSACGSTRSCQYASTSHVLLKSAFFICAVYARFVDNSVVTSLHDCMVSALGLSRLDYCNAVLAGLPAATLAPLQRVLNAAATRPETTWPCNSIPLHNRHKLCLLVNKTFVGHTSVYISDLLTLVADIPTRSSLRASSNDNLFLPRTERRFGERAFSVAAQRVWNRLPTELKLMRSSTTTFKRHLKTFLFNSAHSSHWL